jgi:hypothetical protein
MWIAPSSAGLLRSGVVQRFITRTCISKSIFPAEISATLVFWRYIATHKKKELMLAWEKETHLVLKTINEHGL